MKKRFKVSVSQEGEWYVAQCLEVDVASQGLSLEESLANLKEALELHFQDPKATELPNIGEIEIEVSAA